MSSHHSFSALILAGGQSRRMGTDKALLRINGSTLLAHMQQLATDAGASEILISRNQPGFINDTCLQGGPLAGIQAALQYCTTLQLLVLPIDTPLLTPASLTQLRQTAGSGAAYCSNSPLPCVLPVNAELAHILDHQLRRGQRAVNLLLKQLNAKSVPLASQELLNSNTPLDWQQCLSHLNDRNDHAKA